LCKRWFVLKKLGSIVLAYGFVILLGSIGIIPHGSDAYRMALHGRAYISRQTIESLIASGRISQSELLSAITSVLLWPIF
jgi:hypothetical protein